MEAPGVRGNNPLTALSESLAAAVERAGPAIVALDARPRVATSGVVWRAGVVVSTNHTVRRDEEVAITLHDGRRLQATLAGRDPSTDLAVLRYESGAAAGAEAVAETSEGTGLKVGHLVLAVGRADPERGLSASLGAVALLAGEWRTWRGGEIDRLIRPDVSIFIGFSGGALVDTEGRVIGINTTGLARGAGLTVPAATVNRVVDRLLQHGRIARPYLGVGMYPVALPEKLREKLNLQQPSGLMLLSVEAGAPADRAGVQLGDILIALDGAPTVDTDDVQAVLVGKEIGAVVKASVIRGGEMREADITLGERPKRKR